MKMSSSASCLQPSVDIDYVKLTKLNLHAQTSFVKIFQCLENRTVSFIQSQYSCSMVSLLIKMLIQSQQLNMI